MTTSKYTKYSKPTDEKTLPYVVFHCEYNKNFKTDKGLSPKDLERKERSDFFRCKNPGNEVIRYLLRTNSGVDKMSLEDVSKISHVMQKNNISQNDYLNYANFRPGSSGAFNLDGDIELKDLMRIKKDLATTESVVWDGVISFAEEYGKKNCPTKYEAYEMLKKIMPQFFKDSGLDPKNMNTMFAMHHNTDNLHIHFLFWEKEPLLIDKNGKAVFHKEIIPNLGHINDITRLNIMNHFGLNNQKRYDAFNKAKAEFYQNIVQGKYAQQVKELHEILKNNKLKQFSRISNDKKEAIKKFYNFLLDNDPDIKNYYNDFKNILLYEQRQLVKHSDNIRNRETGHIFINLKGIKSFASSRLKDFELRMCNMILKEVPKIKIQKQLTFKDNLKFHKLPKTHAVEKMYISNDKKIATRNTANINKFHAKYNDYFLKHIALAEREITHYWYNFGNTTFVEYWYQFNENKSSEEFLEGKEFEER